MYSYDFHLQGFQQPENRRRITFSKLPNPHLLISLKQHLKPGDRSNMLLQGFCDLRPPSAGTSVREWQRHHNIFKSAERSQKPSNSVVRPQEEPGRPLPTSSTTQPLPRLPGPVRRHSPAPSRLPAPSAQVAHDPVQPSGPHGSHPMPGSRRSSATSTQKGEGAADSSSLLCITGETAAMQ